MNELRNPFARLHEQLATARAQPGSTTVLRVLANALDVPHTNVLAFATALTEFHDNIHQCRHLAEKFIPGDREKFIAPLDRVEAMFKGTDMNSQWASYSGHLDEATMLALEFGIYAMSQFHPGASSEKSGQINEFVHKLNKLLDECLVSDMSPDLKKVFVRHLEAIRAAILNFLVDGSAELEAAIDGAVGAMLRHGDSIKAESGTGKAFIGDFFDVLGKVNDLVSGYQTATQIASSAALTLLLPLIN
ncbi:hypothetical protein [Pseudomonas syringae]|uniref:hypothetical protein n=1 Tax=Pseudomonas syringae TaxID=317 RepID=UPI001F456BC6|nr:hypothetical protein [Pseudomonas syringae]MCF5700731.1 hypothetical protein [Pseudomonas syringae]